MSDTDFEVRLAHQLNEYAAAGVRPIDGYAIAEATIATGSRRRLGIRLGGLRPVFGVAPRVVFVILTLLTLAVALWIVGQQRPGIPTGSLAYIQGGDVYVADLDGTDAVELLDDAAVDFTRVTWLGRGERLAVEGQGPITIIDLASSERRRVSNPGSTPLWRPSGHEFVSVRGRDGLPSVVMITDALTGESRDLVTDGPFDPQAWSPDGAWLVGTQDGAMVVVDPVSAETRVVTTSTDDGSDPAVPNGFADIAWSPEGSRLAYVASTYGECTGDAEQSLCTPGTNSVLVVPVVGGPPTPVRVAGPITDDISSTTGYYNLGPRPLPAWSPDGKWIAYRAGPGLSIVRPDGSDKRDLVTSPIAWFEWASDSSGLEFVATSTLDDPAGELSWIGLTDDAPRALGLSAVGHLDGIDAPTARITVPSAGPTSTPAPGAPSTVAAPAPAAPVDPSATWGGLAFATGLRGCQAIQRLDFGSAGEPRAATDCAERAIVNPDGIHAAVGGESVVNIVDMRDGSRTTIATHADSLSWLDWSPGGRWLTWRGGGKDFIVAMDGKDRIELPIVGGGTWDLPSWSPDDSRLAVAIPDGLLVGDGSGADLREIGAFPPVWTWSHDGSRFAFIRDGDVWVANSDGTDARNVTQFEFGGARSTAMAPDGESIAVVQAAKALWLMGLDGTRRQVDLGPGVSLEYVDLRWSKEGKRLAVETRPSSGEAARTTYLVPVEGSPVVRLDGAWNPTWSPDGRYLALQGDHDGTVGINVANADGSGLATVTSGPVEAWGELAWVP
jgi:Tol biopolymer transport system component